MMGALPVSIGPYKIVRQLGEGGMGVVFEAVHEAIERRVAIKTLRSEYAKNREVVTRFFNEARAVNRIEHASLVQVSDYGQTDDGTVYLVMEYLRGETLRSRLERLHGRGERLAIERIALFGWQTAAALAAAHAKSIVHRDLKPDNLMLVTDPSVPGGERIKILDFGIAKLLQASQIVTVQPRVMGTPRYMSPEQCKGRGTLDGRSDVYSLGILLFEMLAGQSPFTSDSIEGFLAQHLFQDPPRLAPLAPFIPPALVELVESMIRKEPDARPSMAFVADELSRRQAFIAPLAPTADLPPATNLLPVNIAHASTLGRPLGNKRKINRRIISYLAIGLMFIIAVSAIIGQLHPAIVSRTAGVFRNPTKPNLHSTPTDTRTGTAPKLETQRDATESPPFMEKPASEISGPLARPAQTETANLAGATSEASKSQKTSPPTAHEKRLRSPDTSSPVSTRSASRVSTRSAPATLQAASQTPPGTSKAAESTILTPPQTKKRRTYVD